MKPFIDNPSTTDQIVSQASSEPSRKPGVPMVGALPPVEIAVKVDKAGGAKATRRWSRAFEILRWRGPWRFLLLTLREVVRPLVYWHAYYIIQNDMQPPIPTPPAREEFETTVYEGEQDLENAKAVLAEMKELTGEEVALRLKRGDAVAITSAGERAIGYLWMTFCSGLELAFDTAWIVHPNEAVLYDAFVHPDWRGRGIHACMDIALNNWAYPRGITRAFASIATLNNQSLGITKLAGKARIMTLVLVRVRGFDQTWIQARGGPFESYFQRKSPPLTR
jgi:GNAT superfamily N-acetyltransferase